MFVENQGKTKCIKLKSIRKEDEYSNKVLCKVNEIASKYQSHTYESASNAKADKEIYNYLSTQKKDYNIYVNGKLFATYKNIDDRNMEYNNVINALDSSDKTRVRAYRLMEDR